MIIWRVVATVHVDVMVDCKWFIYRGSNSARLLIVNYLFGFQLDGLHGNCEAAKLRNSQNFEDQSGIGGTVGCFESNCVCVRSLQKEVGHSVSGEPIC